MEVDIDSLRARVEGRPLNAPSASLKVDQGVDNVVSKPACDNLVGELMTRTTKLQPDPMAAGAAALRLSQACNGQGLDKKHAKVVIVPEPNLRMQEVALEHLAEVSAETEPEVSTAVEVLPSKGQHIAQLCQDGVLDHLHGEPRITQGPSREKYRHRLVAYGLAEGKSYEAISVSTGYSTGHISNLAAARWMQAIVLTVQATLSIDSLNMMLRESAASSVATMITLRDDPKTPAAVRGAMAEKLLERVMGKANQPITLSKGTDVKDAISEMADIEAQLIKLTPVPSAHQVVEVPKPERLH